MRCDQCKFWKPTELRDTEDLDITVRRCIRVPMSWDVGEWADAGGDLLPARRVKEEYRGTKMFVKDGSDYWAALFTTADFFCAHFEEK